MFKQLSSWFLILLLTLSVGAKELVMGFCLCEQTFFLSEIPCSKNQNTQATGGSCCGGGPASTNSQNPADDCFVKVAFEVPDYLWVENEAEFSENSLAELNGEAPPIAVLLAAHADAQFFVTRPPPPPGRALFLRHQSLLL